MQKKGVLKNWVTAALLAAAITIMTAFIFHVPVGASGGYIHFGDALIYLAACLLPTPYAIAAAVIGGGLADLLTAPAWMFASVIIKALIVLPFTSHGGRFVCKRNVLATVAAGVITVAGYYLAEGILFGGWAALVLSVTANLTQAVGSAVVFLILASALDRLDLKARLAIR
ncbi:hypothetical protein SDC9_65660 [bioreactor metagenome]|uniref:TIGR04002 family protein n=1 Tax=bioreactor metagenome TaxID=1076179 RepID=A0A644XSM5_9ZZZZ